MRIAALMGSYHLDGALATAAAEVLAGARDAGAATETVVLVERHLEHCRNCRACAQVPGPDRGACVLDDELDQVLEPLEAADALVLGAPVNCGDVNALTRKLLERMLGCAYWPWERKWPTQRRRGPARPAVLVTSSAAPALMTRYLARPLRTLREMARLLNARPLGTLVVGLAGQRDFRVNPRDLRRARELGRRLATCVGEPAHPPVRIAYPIT